MLMVKKVSAIGRRGLESRTRSILKSVTFRIIVILSDIIVIYVLTHRIGLTIALTILTNIASTVLYYLHERIWNAVKWGRR